MEDGQPHIQLFNETSLSLPLTSDEATDIASTIEQSEGCSYQFIEIVFVDEPEIVRVNQEHLGRDYITDIITFRYDEGDDDKAIEGTLFCCAPRITEQAQEFEQPLEREFLRIVIHGLLHLAGYEDQTKDQKEQMTSKENYFLATVE